MLILLFAPYPSLVPETKYEKLDYSKPIFTTYGTMVCPTSLLSDMQADQSPDKIVLMFYSFLDRNSEAEKQTDFADTATEKARRNCKESEKETPCWMG